MGMVELEKVVTDEDKQTLRRMIEAHHKYTGSRKAKLVLDSWEAMLPKFVKIMPIDYNECWRSGRRRPPRGRRRRTRNS